MKRTVINSKIADTFTFGIEIETTMPASAIDFTVGGYRRGVQIPALPRGWKAETDGSLSTQRAGFRCLEIVSPILKGRAGLEQVRQVAEWLASKGARTNSSCGTHIHVGVESVAGTNPTKQAAWVANLINVFAQYERAVQGAAGSRTRAERGQWCGSIKRDRNYKETAERVQNASASRKANRLGSFGQRYRTLNLTNLRNGSKKTVEFRAFSGTTEAPKMIAWIQLCLALAERALGRKVVWDKPESNIYRGGESKKELDRFFYLMGWTAGRKNPTKPECDAAGYIDDMSNMEATKKLLRKLCKKFDNDGR